VLSNCLRNSGRVDVITSTQRSTPVEIFLQSYDRGEGSAASTDDQRSQRGYREALLSEHAGFVAAFNPLDDSREAEAGMSAGTIFGIYMQPEVCEVPDDEEAGARQARPPLLRLTHRLSHSRSRAIECTGTLAACQRVRCARALVRSLRMRMARCARALCAGTVGGHFSRWAALRPVLPSLRPPRLSARDRPQPSTYAHPRVTTLAAGKNEDEEDVDLESGGSVNRPIDGPDFSGTPAAGEAGDDGTPAAFSAAELDCLSKTLRPGRCVLRGTPAVRACSVGCARLFCTMGVVACSVGMWRRVVLVLWACGDCSAKLASRLLYNIVGCAVRGERLGCCAVCGGAQA
jgi:hypothetical protein